MNLISKILQQLNLRSSDDIVLPSSQIDRIVGQERAKYALFSALKHNRHVLMIGAPGVGKSALSKAISSQIKPSGKLLIATPNHQDTSKPRVELKSANFDLKATQKLLKQNKTLQRYTPLTVIANLLAGLGVLTLFIAMYLTFRTYSYAANFLQPMIKPKQNFFNVFSTFFKILLKLTWSLVTQSYVLFGIVTVGPIIAMLLNQVKKPVLLNPDDYLAEAVLVYKYDTAFIDASTSKPTQILGTVLHDPYGGLFAHTNYDVTPKLLIPGFIHKAHEGILYIDELGVLDADVQYALLTIMQDRVAPITGSTHQTGSNSHVKTNNIPCDFRLIVCGNFETVAKLHPALRSRIRSYGYEIYMDSATVINQAHTREMLWFIKQALTQIKNGKNTRFNLAALTELLHYAERLSGKSGYYTLRLRQFSVVIRDCVDIVEDLNHAEVTADIVRQAIRQNKPLNKQIIENLNADTLSKSQPILALCGMQVADARIVEADRGAGLTAIPLDIQITKINDSAQPGLLFTNVSPSAMNCRLEFLEYQELCHKFLLIQTTTYADYAKYMISTPLWTPSLQLHYPGMLLPILARIREWRVEGATKPVVYIGYVRSDGTVYATITLATIVSLAIEQGYHVCTHEIFKDLLTGHQATFINNIKQLQVTLNEFPQFF